MADRKRSGSSQDKWQQDLSESLRRAGEQLAVGLANEAVSRATRFAEDAERRRQEREVLREGRRQHRAERKAEKKHARWVAKYSRTTAVEGWGLSVLVLCVMVLIAMHVLPWWMIFVAIVVGMRAAQIVSFHSWRRAEEAPLPAVEVPSLRDPREARIDEICDKLKNAVKDAPESVKSFLSRPEETVEALRKTSHDLLRKELSLRALVNPEETTRLARERNALQARIEMEPDEIIRQRLTGALEALENQRTQHAEVSKAAGRLEAERTRLGYTLEGLYAQIMRVRTADAASSDLVSAGLRMSLDQLRDEMSALAEAVEDVNKTSSTKGFDGPESFEATGSSRASARVR